MGWGGANYKYTRQEGRRRVSSVARGFLSELGSLITLNGGGGDVLSIRRVGSFFGSVRLGTSRVRGMFSCLRTGGVSILHVDKSAPSRISMSLSSVVVSRRSSISVRGVSLSIPRNIDVRSPIHVCLGRVNGMPLLDTRHRVRLTREVRRNSRRTGGRLTRTGLELMIDVTGECIKENVLFLSLVRRNGLNLVGTIRGFSCRGKCGFDACTA